MKFATQCSIPLSDHEVRQSKPSRDILMELFTPRSRTNRSGWQSEFMKILEKRKRIMILFKDLCRPSSLVLVDPVSLPLPAHVSDPEGWIRRDNEDWVENLVCQLKYDKIGQWEYTGDRCIKYTFFEVNKTSGTWQNDFKRVKSTHEVVNARVRRLPCKELAKPKKAEAMIQRIMQERDLYKHFGIITGKLVAHGSNVTEQWQEDTQLKKNVDWAKAKVTSSAQTTGRVLSAVAMAPLSMMASLLDDPALIFGSDIAFIGWK